ncbi:MAG: DUF1292 domain-containing protein [Clostridia bacterium]|nr:DUF1292 domain-containing protein [Clostridia bacterium]
MSENNNFGNDIITLVDDDGKEYAFEVLDAIETDDGRYLAMLPYYTDAKEKLDDSGELVLVKSILDEDGEEYFEDIPDDDEYETVADLFISRLQDEFEINEE